MKKVLSSATAAIFVLAFGMAFAFANSIELRDGSSISGFDSGNVILAGGNKGQREEGSGAGGQQDSEGMGTGGTTTPDGMGTGGTTTPDGMGTGGTTTDGAGAGGTDMDSGTGGSSGDNGSDENKM